MVKIYISIDYKILDIIILLIQEIVIYYYIKNLSLYFYNRFKVLNKTNLFNKSSTGILLADKKVIIRFFLVNIKR